MTCAKKQRYGVAVLAVLSAWLLMLWLDPWMSMKNSPFLMFFGAVLISAWYGGMGPGLLATFLSVPISTFFFIAPENSLLLQLSDSLRLFLFVLQGILMSSLCGALRTSNWRLEVSLLKLRASEEALRQSEEQFRLAIDNFPDTFAIYDANRRLQYVNARGVELTNKPLEHLLGRTDEEIWPSQVTAAYLPLLHRAVETRTLQSAECQISLPDNGTFTMILKYVPVLAPTGEISSILGITYDITARQQAEEAARRREDELRLITNAVPVLISYVDAQQRYRFNNKAYEDWFGRPATDVYGKSLQEVLGESAYEAIYPYVETVLSGHKVTFESKIPYRDAGTRYINATYVPQFGDRGDIEGFVALVSDITEHKHLENNLRQSEARFRRLVESNIIGVFFPDLEGNIFEGNDAFLQMVGYTRADLHQGKLNWKTMSPPEYDAIDQQKITELKTLGICSPFEKEYIRKDGSRIPILVGAALLDEPIQQTVAFAVDLSDRKQAIEALRESEKRFRQMADIAPVLIWMSGTQKLCNYFNKPWLDFTGRTLEQEIGNGWTEGIHPEDFQYCVSTYTHAFENRQPFKMEYRLRRFDGEYCWLLNTGIPRFTPEGHFLGYIGSCLDISDRKQIEADMRRLNEILEQRVKERTAQLEDANQELESFSYSVSHDLRAPLRHISGFVELLRKRAVTTLDETSLRYLDTIAQTTKHAGTLIDNLLAFSRMGRTEMRYITLNMNQLIQEVQHEIQLETDGRTIHWQIDELPQVYGDPAMLRLVVGNLIQNALKYTQTRAEAKIEIGSTENDQEVVFFVRDNGVGFDMRYAHKLFGVFQRLHSVEEFEGTGIGLANVKRIVHRHGGRTWAEGVCDRGATFYFSLPKILTTDN